MVVTPTGCRILSLCVVWGALVLCSQPVRADEAGTSPPTKSLEFRLRGDFSLSSFRGGTVSWKEYHAPNRARRFGVSPSVQNDRDGEGYWEQSRREWSLELVAQELSFLPSRSLARPYWGWGGFTRLERREVIDRWGEESESTSTFRRNTWGFLATLGAEFSVAGRAVLGAEVSLTASRQKSRRREDRLEYGGLVFHSASEAVSYDLGFESAALTVAVLF